MKLDFFDNFFDMHRHDEYSTFDGFGKAERIAKLAKDRLGYSCLGLSNHGNVSGLVKHYKACLKHGLKPIMGMEAYFQPKFNKEKPQYHLGLYATNLDGWNSLMSLTDCGSKQFYKKPIVTFKDLKKHNKGLICTSACIAGLIPQMIKKEADENVIEKAILNFKKIFGDRFYIEIMPYKIDEKFKGMDLQKYVNNKLMDIALENDIKCILTTDSHFPIKEDFDTYLVMHGIAGSSYGIHYKERYMPTGEEVYKRFIKMHKSKSKAKELFNNMKELSDRFSDGDWLQFEMEVPAFGETPEESYKMMKRKCIKRLKKLDKWNKTYKDRLKYELDVIKHHGFQDYFLLVQDYVMYAKKQDIAVGPGRGSGGNSLCNYSLGITEVDPIYFDNDFDRFLRKNKKKMPDIDIDFCTNRRYEVIDYIVSKYKGRALQMCSYGFYKVKYLVNDLGKYFNMSEEETKFLQVELAKYCDENSLEIDKNGIKSNANLRRFNKIYTNCIKHFCKLFGQIRYFGKHAAAVAITNTPIAGRTGVMHQQNMYKTQFDLNDLDFLHVLKLDILGLHTASMLKDIEKSTGTKFNYKMLEDKKVYKMFREGKLEAIFQFESPTAIKIATEIGVDNMEDAIAATSLNRPGPLSMKMHKQYAKAKKKPRKDAPWWEYTKQTHGVIIYQEQAMRICREIGELDWDSTDQIIKKDINHLNPEDLKVWEATFIKNAKKKGIGSKDAKELFYALVAYAFNRGHGTGYTMMSIQQMFYKAHYPTQFWAYALRYTVDKYKRELYKGKSVQDGTVILLPHVNGSREDSLEQFDGETVIREGLDTIKNVGGKAAALIEEDKKINGPYKSKDDFLSRLPKRTVNAKVVRALEEHGALEFNEKTFFNRVVQYNSSLYSRFQ